MITLDSTLAEAQDLMLRKPLVKLLATQPEEAIPFDGTYFNPSTVTEEHTTLITSESGVLIGFYIRDDDTLVQIITDTERTFWTENIVSFSIYTVQNIEAVELVVGETGVILTTTNGGLYYVVIDNNGGLIQPRTTIEALSSPEYPLDPSVVKLNDGTYLLTYIVYNSTTLTYEIRKRTSVDFITWSVDSVITLTGLLASRAISNLSLIQVEAGNVVLFFDYVTEEKDEGATLIKNVFQSQSLDSGVTWDDPQQITNYTEWGTSAVNPSVSEKEDGSVVLAYTDSRNVLFANDQTDMWDNDCSVYDNTNATNIHFDPATSRLYIYQIYTYVGTKAICGVVVMDITTWEVVNMYNTMTSPAYNEVFTEVHVWFQKDYGAGKYACFSTYSGTKVLCIINDELESITEYAFNDDDDREISCNVDITYPVHSYLDIEDRISIRSTFVDAVADRVYVFLGYSYVYFRACVLGYIDLLEPIDQATGKYPFHSIFSTSSQWSEVQVSGMEQIIVVPERNFIIVMANSALAGNASYPGKTTIIDITSGGIVKEFSTATHQNYPQGGCFKGCYYEGHLYASFDYVTIDDQENFRGMVDINIDTELIVYHEPTWATLDSYGLTQKVPTNDGRILVGVYGDSPNRPGGVASFDIASGGWYLYNQDTVQGFEPGTGFPSIYSLAYDETTNQIMAGSINPVTENSFVGVRMFDEDGAFNIGKLVEGIDSNGWLWGIPEDLTIGHSEVDMAVTIAPDNVLWSIWTRDDEGELSTKWDRDVREKQLVNHLVAGSSVTVTWSVGSSGTLSFTVSYGHLFDPNNTASTWSSFLKKGKVIELSFGEDIGGVEYWQVQGKYIIDSISLSYVRGTYPIMTVNCESLDNVWSDVNVPATERYDTENPEDVLRGILLDLSNLESSDIDIPVFPNRHEVHHQWLDVDLKTITSNILDHFQCVAYFDMNGIYAPKIIDLTKTVDHIYTGAEIIKFTPDDKYSSYTNRITVTGEGAYFITVTYTEEQVGTVMGSGGWWDESNKDIKVWYSDDKELVCYDPRLVVNTSVKDFKILWIESGGDEYISYVDPDNRYCVVTIEFPQLMEVLIAAILLVVSIGAAASTCTVSCGPYLFALSMAMSTVSYILGQVASYEYEIYAKPTGEEKQMVSAEVNDVDFQRELGGLIVSETFDDPLCYTTQSCDVIAENEMNIVKAQRNRVSFTKLAHLQDEICDVIRIQHPFSKLEMNVFITDLQRTYTRPDKGSPTSGGFTDSITGWRL